MSAYVFSHYNYAIVVILMMMGLYTVFSSGNLVKRLVGLGVFQTSVFLLYITIGKVAGGIPPILPETHHGEAAHAVVHPQHDRELDAQPDPRAVAEADPSVLCGEGSESLQILAAEAAEDIRAAARARREITDPAGDAHQGLSQTRLALARTASPAQEVAPAADTGESADDPEDDADHQHDSHNETHAAPDHGDAHADHGDGTHEDGHGSEHSASHGHEADHGHEGSSAYGDRVEFSADELDGVYSNPLPHVLILTAIVVGVATLAVGLALVVRIRDAFGTIEDDDINRAEHASEVRDASSDGVGRDGAGSGGSGLQPASGAPA